MLLVEQLIEKALVQYARLGGSLVHIVFENIPAGEGDDHLFGREYHEPLAAESDAHPH